MEVEKLAEADQRVSGTIQDGTTRVPYNTIGQHRSFPSGWSGQATSSTPLELVDGYPSLTTDIDDGNGLLRRLFRSNGLYQERDMNYNRIFYRFPRVDPYNYVKGTKEYVFFTKPDLNLLGSNGNLNEDAGKITYFNNLIARGYGQTIFHDLCHNTSGDQVISAFCPFIHILSNRKTSNIDVPDIQVDEIQSPVNLYGSYISYPKSSVLSDENAEFTMEFEDTKFLEVYQLFKVWDIYRQAAWLGIVTPKLTYVQNKILADHIAVYKFIVADDGETLLYWCKFTGVYPNSISRSSFNEIPEGGPLKVTVGFKMSGFFEDLEPTILSEFNQLVFSWIGARGSNGNRTAELWDDQIQAISGEEVDYPYIEQAATWDGAVDEHNYAQYSLKWGVFN